MNYLSCADAAKAMGITVRRIQQMCKSGEIPGVFKEGRSWLIPENSVLLEEGEKKKPLPIGVSDFKVATTNYYYVDKTLLIRDFLDTKPLVSLFTRPRRFGKTLNIYSFLLVAGYLKVSAVYPQNDGNFMCDVAIPNKEIAFVYEKEILNRTNQNGVSVSISQAVFSGNAQKLQDLLEDFMLRSISSMDGANEGFYHGMMLGLCAVLGNRYRIRSNREAGLGRFDIQLSPLVSGIPGFLFEFKHTKDERVNLAVLADSALQQINEKKYDTELRNAGVNSIIKIGIAFRGKNAVVKRG